MLFVNEEGGITENELSNIIFFSLQKYFSGWLDHSHVT